MCVSIHAGIGILLWYKLYRPDKWQFQEATSDPLSSLSPCDVCYRETASNISPHVTGMAQISCHAVQCYSF